MAVPLRLGGPDAPPGGTRRTGYTTRGSSGWTSGLPASYRGPVYGSWQGVRAKPPKIKNAGQRGLLFIRNTDGRPGGRWVARRPAPQAPKPPLDPKVVTGTVAPAAGTDGGYIGPYAEYPEWARRVLQGVDTDFANHSRYVGFDPTTGNPTGGGVASWLSSALNGVNQMAGGMLGEYQGNMGHVAGAVDQAAGATPAFVTSPLAGGVVSSPTAYEYRGRSQGMAGEADSIRGQAAAQVTQARSNLGLSSQGYINSLADYAKGLPAVYAERRRAAREEIDKFIATAAQEQAQLELDQAKFEETQRSNRADEAIRTLNSRNGLITALVNSGIKIDQNTLRAIDMATDNERQQQAQNVRTADVQADNARADAAEARQQRTAAQRARSGGGTTGRTSDWYRQRGYSRPGGNVNVGKLNTQVWDVGRDNTGQVWVKRRANSAANGGGTPTTSRTTPSTPTPVTTLVTDLSGDYRNTIEPNRPSDPGGAANDVVKWIKSNRAAFTRADGSVDMGKVLRVLNSSLGNDTSVAGSVPARAWRLFQSSVKKQGNRYYWGR